MRELAKRKGKAEGMGWSELDLVWLGSAGPTRWSWGKASWYKVR